MVALTSPLTLELPTQNDLPYDDNENMETLRHKCQMDLLLETIYPWLQQRQNGFAGGNMFVYYSIAQVKNKDYKGPDFFCVLDVPPTERKSWIVWEEGKAPDLVIELLSDSTANYDKNEKKLIYQNGMRVPEYFWYDPFNPEDWAGFSLVKGVYQPLPLDNQNRYISEQLQLALTKWRGVYRGIEAVWLRWQTLDGELLPTDREVSECERQRAEVERQRAEAERQRAEAEKQRAEAERQRADQAQLEITKLKELLQNNDIDIPN